MSDGSHENTNHEVHELYIIASDLDEHIKTSRKIEEDIYKAIGKLEDKIIELQDYMEKSLFLISMNIDAAHSRIKFMEARLDGKTFSSQYHANPDPKPEGKRTLVKCEGQTIINEK
jgi:hypothetical protein